MGTAHFLAQVRAVPVPDGGHRFPLAEPGSGGEYLVEPVRAQGLAGLGDRLGSVALDNPRTRLDVQRAPVDWSLIFCRSAQAACPVDRRASDVKAVE
jgi:hypothetical protein